MVEKFYPYGKLCISSVQKKEEGFEDYRYTAYVAAEELGFHAIRNPEMEEMTQEEFERCLRVDNPVFILLVGSVESLIVNKEVKLALEKCLPILVFIKTKNDEISIQSGSIVTKLSKVAYDYQCTKFSSCEDLYKKVCARLKSYILNKESIHPILEQGVSLAYKANTELMKKSKRQIAIYQSTSILLLGPRKGCDYESAFYKELMEWLLTKQNDEIKFVHVFNWEETVREKCEHSDNYHLEAARNNLLELYRLFRGDDLNIRYSTICNTIPYVITDTNLVFVIPIENEKFSIELPSHIMQEQEVRKILDEITRKTTIMNIDKLLKFYD